MYNTQDKIIVTGLDVVRGEVMTLDRKIGTKEWIARDKNGHEWALTEREFDPVPSPIPFSNGLSEAEVERLAILAEEAAEVSQVAMKTLRHGYESVKPGTEQNNRQRLESELGDLFNAIGLMGFKGDVSKENIIANEEKKWQSFRKYLHHQDFNDEAQNEPPV